MGQSFPKQTPSKNQILEITQIMLQDRHKNFVTEVTHKAKATTLKQVPFRYVLQDKYHIGFNIQQEENFQILMQKIYMVANQLSAQQFAQAIVAKFGYPLQQIMRKWPVKLQEFKGYLIYVGVTGAIMRMDYLIFVKKFQYILAEQLEQLHFSSLFLISYVLSSIDLSKIDEKQLFEAFQRCYTDFGQHEVPIQFIEPLKQSFRSLYRPDSRLEFKFPQQSQE